MWKCRAALVAAFFFWACGAVAQQGSAVAVPSSAKSKSCLVAPDSGRPRGLFPVNAKVFAVLTFAGGPEDPPGVEVLYSTEPPKVVDFLIENWKSYRFVCPRPADMDPITVDQSLVFFKGAPPSSLLKERQMSLTRFLDMTKLVPGEKVDIDLDAMRCPFAVVWTSLKPAAPNRARATTGISGIDRGPLLRWLAGLELDMSDAVREQLIGEVIQVQIPCGRINLAPPAGAASSAG